MCVAASLRSMRAWRGSAGTSSKVCSLATVVSFGSLNGAFSRAPRTGTSTTACASRTAISACSTKPPAIYSSITKGRSWSASFRSLCSVAGAGTYCPSRDTHAHSSLTTNSSTSQRKIRQSWQRSRSLFRFSVARLLPSNALHQTSKGRAQNLEGHPRYLEHLIRSRSWLSIRPTRLRAKARRVRRPRE